MREPSSRCFGITGGLGCGKTTLGKLLASHGWAIIDTDQIAHELMQPEKENWKKIVDAFGSRILNEDRSINRRVLGELVFENLEARKKLNKLTHPAIHHAWILQRDNHLSKRPYQSLAVIIPLLFESSLDNVFTQVMCVACRSVTQWRRLENRGWTSQHCLQRLESQLPTSEKIQRSHLVFWNEGSQSCLERQVQHFLSLLSYGSS